MQAGQHLDAVEESNHTLGARLEISLILRRPPVAKVAIFVELAALIVEAVRHFVADHHANRAVVGRIVGCGIEERRLENAGGEANFVGCRVVVGIDRLRCHEPLVAIDGFVDAARNFIRIVEFFSTAQILVEREFLVNHQTIVVSPLVRITNLDAKCVELLVCLLFSGGTHPSLLINALTEGFLQIVHELKHALLGAFGEITLNIHFADGHSQNILYSTHRALPTRAVLLRTLHRAAVEIERDTAEIIAQCRGGAVDHVEFEIRFECFERSIGENLLHLVNGLRLVDTYFGKRGIALILEQHFPINARIIAQEFGVGHLVIIAFHVAQLGGRIGSFGNARLDVEHLLHLLRGFCLGGAGHDKQLLDIGAIGLTNLARLGIIFQIVVAFAKCQAALVDLHQVHLGILDVGAATDPDHARNPAAFQTIGQREIGRLVPEGAHFVQRGTNGFVAFAIASHAVHRKSIERSDLLRQTAVGCGFRGEVFDQRANALLIHLFELIELGIASVFGRERVGFHPTATGILIEILAGTSREIHVGTIKRAYRRLR